MRTTVTIDPDVEKLLKDESIRTRKSFKKVLNESIRKSLKPASPHRPKLLPGKRLDLLPGIDSRRLNQLVDDLEADAFSERHNQKNP